MDDRRGADDRTDVAVVGGGIAGLVAAIEARHQGATVTLSEPHPLGGRGRTDRRNGFTFNRGPRALYRGGPAEAALARLGVDVGSGGLPITSGAVALVGDRCHRLPTSPAATVATGLFTAREKVTATRHLLPILRDPGPVPADVTLAAWLDGRGTSGTVRAFLEAMVRVATYTDAPGVVPAGEALAQVRAATGLGVRYLDGGFGSIVDALAAIAAAEGVVIAPTAVQTVLPDADGGWRLDTASATRRADAVVVAAGTPAATSGLVAGGIDGLDALGPPARAACLELGLRRVPARRFALGMDRPTYLSVHSPPADLAPDGGAVVHVMRYRRPDDDLDPERGRAELQAVARAVGITDDDIVAQRYLDAMVVTGAVPAAATGGLAGRPPVADDRRPGVFLAGDWVGPEGWLLDGAVASAVVAGRAAGRHAVARRATMAPT